MEEPGGVGSPILTKLAQVEVMRVDMGMSASGRLRGVAGELPTECGCL